MKYLKKFNESESSDIKDINHFKALKKQISNNYTKEELYELLGKKDDNYLGDNLYRHINDIIRLEIMDEFFYPITDMGWKLLLTSTAGEYKAYGSILVSDFLSFTIEPLISDDDDDESLYSNFKNTYIEGIIDNRGIRYSNEKYNKENEYINEFMDSFITCIERLHNFTSLSLSFAIYGATSYINIPYKIKK
jgi:hypothetical protein